MVFGLVAFGVEALAASVVLIPGTLATRAAPSWQPTVHVGLKIQVVMLGLEGHDAVTSGPGVNAKALANYLEEALPQYDCPILPGGQSQGPSPLRVVYRVGYAVTHLGKTALQQYTEALASAAVVEASQTPGAPARVLVPVGAADLMLQKLAKSNHVDGSGEYVQLLGVPLITPDSQEFSLGETKVTVWVVQADQAELVRLMVDAGKMTASDSDKVTYSFLEPGGTHAPHAEGSPLNSSCAQAWVGGARQLVLDLGASACEYGSMNPFGPEGTTSPGRFPAAPGSGIASARLFGGSSDGQQDHPEPGGGSGVEEHLAFSSKLASVLVSAVRTVLAPPVPSLPAAARPGSTLLVPVVVFRGAGHRRDEEREHPGSKHHERHMSVVDFAQVRRAVEAVALPGQEVLVVGAVHTLEEHPQVAVALAKSIVTRAPQNHRAGEHTGPPGLAPKQAHVDSASLMHHMRSAGDSLAGALLRDAGGGSHDLLLEMDLALEAGESPEALDMGRSHRAWLFEDSSAVAAHPGAGAVLVLQADEEHSGKVPVPFHERGAQLEVSLESATQSVAAGVISAVFGVGPPHRWWSPAHGGPSLDFTWAHGFHPFMPFGFGGASDAPTGVLGLTASRNAILSVLAGAAATTAAAMALLREFARRELPDGILTGDDGWMGSHTQHWEKWDLPLVEAWHAHGPAHRALQGLRDAQQAVQALADRWEERLHLLTRWRASRALAEAQALHATAQKVLEEVERAIGFASRQLHCCQLVPRPVQDINLLLAGVVALVSAVTVGLGCVVLHSLLKRYVHSAGQPTGRLSGGRKITSW